MNKVPSKSVKKTPYELWNGKPPKLNYMKVWSCVAHVLILDPGRDKLLAKTKRCLFVGYLKHSKRYKLYNLIEQIIIERRHVKFIEE